MPSIQNIECSALNKIHRIWSKICQITIAATSRSCDFLQDFCLGRLFLRHFLQTLGFVFSSLEFSIGFKGWEVIFILFWIRNLVFLVLLQFCDWGKWPSLLHTKQFLSNALQLIGYKWQYRLKLHLLHFWSERSACASGQHLGGHYFV